MSTILIIIIGCALLGFKIYMDQKMHNQLKSEGKVIDRDQKYMEKAEDFILSARTPDQVAEHVRKLPVSDFKVSMRSSSNETFQFFTDYWEAELYLKNKDENGSMIYRFQFKRWKTRNGMMYGEEYMNMLLTAVEQMFLNIDPDTQVRTEMLETKTKHHFF